MIPAPHAYVVEYRAADACSPPHCVLAGSAAYGNAAVSGPGGKPGGYVIVGNDHDEMFAKRGVVLAPHGALTFTLDASEHASVLELDVAAIEPRGGPFRVVVEILAGGARLDQSSIGGVTAPYVLRAEVGELGREERYFTHVRKPLPSRDGRALTVSIRNEEDAPVGVGAPLVLSRVEGRAPRHGVFVFFDAVPHPALGQMFAGGADEKTRWLPTWIANDGLLFEQGRSPGQLTGSFVRRFFKADFFRLDGEPSLFGQGFDETPPERARGPVARLAEQGFVTVAAGSNLYLSPVLSRIGFDSAYNIESTLELQLHPPVLARRFADAMQQHAEDDCFFVVWFANTHMPWREGRRDAPPLRDPRLGELDHDVLDPIWKNLLESVDALESIHEAATRAAPAAERLWVLGTDHGHTFTVKDRDRPWRLTRETFARGHMHCCLATEQESRTPFVVVSENGKKLRGVVHTPQSSMVAWRALERRFGLDIELPHTSAFAFPEEEEARWGDGIVVSIGNSNAVSGRWGHWSYRSYQPALGLAPIWDVTPQVALLLAGTPARAGGVVAEELYDVDADPGEERNLADARFGELLSMRARMAAFMASYVDTPEHPRYRYRLEFAGPAPRAVVGPRTFLGGEEGQAPVETSSLSTRGATLALEDGSDPLGLIELKEPGHKGSWLVRCAASGLPLATITEDEPRLNLAVARTNCVGDGEKGLTPSPGEVLFSATPVVSARAGKGPLSDKALPELHNALRRWGYVRDK